MDPANATAAIWIGGITPGCQCHIRVHFDNSMDFPFQPTSFLRIQTFVCVYNGLTCIYICSIGEGS